MDCKRCLILHYQYSYLLMYMTLSGLSMTSLLPTINALRQDAKLNRTITRDHTSLAQLEITTANHTAAQKINKQNLQSLPLKKGDDEKSSSTYYTNTDPYELKDLQSSVNSRRKYLPPTTLWSADTYFIQIKPIVAFSA